MVVGQIEQFLPGILVILLCVKEAGLASIEYTGNIGAPCQRDGIAAQRGYLEGPGRRMDAQGILAVIAKDNGQLIVYELVEGLEDAAERRAAIAGSPKPGCLVVDFVGNAGRHKLMTTADILGGKASDEAVAEAVAKAKASGKPVRMDEAIDLAETELADRRRQAAQRARLRARARWTSAAVSPFDVFALTPARERGWDSGRSPGWTRQGGWRPRTMP